MRSGAGQRRKEIAVAPGRPVEADAPRMKTLLGASLAAF
jgi:hypothetical protein